MSSRYQVTIRDDWGEEDECGFMVKVRNERLEDALFEALRGIECRTPRMELLLAQVVDLVLDDQHTADHWPGLNDDIDALMGAVQRIIHGWKKHDEARDARK